MPLYFVHDEQTGKAWVYDTLEEAESKQRKREKFWKAIWFEDDANVFVYEVNKD